MKEHHLLAYILVYLSATNTFPTLALNNHLPKLSGKISNNVVRGLSILPLIPLLTGDSAPLERVGMIMAYTSAHIAIKDIVNEKKTDMQRFAFLVAITASLVLAYTNRTARDNIYGIYALCAVYAGLLVATRNLKVDDIFDDVIMSHLVFHFTK